jgi:hypothetical protein
MHKGLKKVWSTILSLTGCKVEKLEPQFKPREDGTMPQSDIRISNWEDGKDLVIDVTHNSTQAKNNKKIILHRNVKGFKMNNLTKHYQNAKDASQAQLCDEKGWLGRGIAHDSAGSSSKHAQFTLTEAVNKMIECGNPVPKSILTSYYRKMISCVIHKTFASSTLQMQAIVATAQDRVSELDHHNRHFSTFHFGDRPAQKVLKPTEFTIMTPPEVAGTLMVTTLIR